MAATTSWHLRDQWRALKRSQAGHRFQDRYERARRHGGKSSLLQRFALVAVGVAFLGLGAFFAVVPGPALPFFFLAGGLLASESLTMARFMDWSETKIRQMAKWGKRHWHRLPTVARVALVVLGMCCSFGGAYFSYRLFRD